MLLVKRKKRYCVTTDSKHGFEVHKNLKKDMELARSNECWVADITYIRTDSGFVYLSLLTDAYSRKIVGWNLNRSLAVEGAYGALGMALKQRKDSSKPLIHHSDRGIQYCCKKYTKKLKKSNIGISMTEENHCYENGLAERVNGILKQEFMLDATFKNYKSAYRAVKEAIKIYNDDRPHLSLNMQTPSMVHSTVA